MPDGPAPIVGTPNLAYQPYDATIEGTVAGWKSVDPNSGPCDMNGNVTGDFESGDGWKQT